MPTAGSESAGHEPRFDFERLFDRSGTGSSKWAAAGAEGHPERIALGLADMDLPGPSAIGEALAGRAAHPALGYTLCDPRSRDLVAAWYRDRHGTAIDPDWVLILPFGPRTAVRLLLETLRAGAAPDRPVGPVLIPTPEYGGFAPTCRAAGVPYEEVPLTLDSSGYRLPVAEFARRGARPLTAVLLSSPHNPTARVWQRPAIRALAEVAAAGGGLLLSDEVHADLVHPGGRHPVAVDAAADLADRTVTLHSVGKTFNTTGLPSAYALIPDPELRTRLLDVMAGYGLWEGGLLTQVVQNAALRHGGPWLDALLGHLAANRELAVRALRRLAPEAVPSPPQASFVLWLDARALGLPADGAGELLRRRCGLDLQDGSRFGSAGRGFLRLNYALPRTRLVLALDRLSRLVAAGA